MHLSGDFTFEGPRDTVWTLLHDPAVLQAAMPGVRSFAQTGEDAYHGEIQVKVGPVNGVFQVQVTLAEQQPPDAYTMMVDSQGTTGFARGSARVTLTEAGAGATEMHYEATLQVGGRLASVGQRMLDTVSKSLTRQSLEAMNQALQARLGDREADGEDDGEDEAYVPPTQADVARQVARDVVADTVTARPFVWIAVAAAVLIVIALLLF